MTFRKGLDHDKSHDTDPTKIFKMRRYVCNYTIPLKVTVSGEIFKGNINFPVFADFIITATSRINCTKSHFSIQY